MSREYHQFCGLARALDLVGSRWTLLIVRNLLTGPKRFGDLRDGLPGIPTNVLTTRLRELEESGIVRRQLQPRPAKGVVYELTDYGADLEGPLVALGLWGARTMGPRQETDHASMPALALGLRGMFRPARTRGRRLHYELRVDGEAIGVSVDGETVAFDPAPKDAPATVIETDSNTMYELLAGLLDLGPALETDRVRVEGKRDDAVRFFDVFHLEGALVPGRSA
jgi:DNA-binding HxlR family transcriptional regulator